MILQKSFRFADLVLIDSDKVLKKILLLLLWERSYVFRIILKFKRTELI